MATSMLWVATLILYSALSLTEQALPDGGGLGENRYGGCVCNQNCQSEDVFRHFKQLDEKVLSLLSNGETQTENIVQLEKKMESQTENIVQLERKLDLLLEKLEVPCKPPKRRCPADFTYDSDSKICIKLYKDRRSWPAADDFCRHLGDGYRLAVLDTDNKFQFVQKFLLGSGLQIGSSADQCWVGAKQEDGEGRWLWSTGGQVLGGWGPGDPNNYHGDENCLLLAYARGWTAWMFNDGPCTAGVRGRSDFNFQSICEYQLN